MSLQVSFRVVGLYCYFQNLIVPNATADSTVKAVMDQIASLRPAFGYRSIVLPNRKHIVDEMSYTFGPDSTRPFNSSQPAPGPRSLVGTIGPTSLVWQYYRSVTGSIDGTVCEIKLIDDGQESFATQPMNAYDPRFGAVPSAFRISTYNLTWRLVQIQMSPENQAKFMQAKVDALKARAD
jgi:hypothetical protein